VCKLSSNWFKIWLEPIATRSSFNSDLFKLGSDWFDLDMVLAVVYDWLETLFSPVQTGDVLTGWNRVSFQLGSDWFELGLIGTGCS